MQIHVEIMKFFKEKFFNLVFIMLIVFISERESSKSRHNTDCSATEFWTSGNTDSESRPQGSVAVMT